MNNPTRSEYECKNYCSLLSFRWGLSSNGLQIVIVPGASNVHCIYFHKSSSQLCCRVFFFFLYFLCSFWWMFTCYSCSLCLMITIQNHLCLTDCQKLPYEFRNNTEYIRNAIEWNCQGFSLDSWHWMRMLILLPSCACPLMMMLNYATYSYCMHLYTRTRFIKENINLFSLFYSFFFSFAFNIHE